MSRQKRHKPEEIASILKQHEAGLTTAGVCRQYNISGQALYRWKSKYGGRSGAGEAFSGLSRPNFRRHQANAAR